MLKVRQAKINARMELSSYEEKLREETQEKITELNINRQGFDEIDKITEEELKEIDETFNKNKNKVIDFLFDSVVQVNIDIPDVVKGNFEENFNW